jgi:hypothetical protein
MLQQFYPVWDDLRFPVVGINPTGAASDPTIDNVLADYPGTLLFSGTTENIISVIVQLPHGWMEKTELRPHLHWSKPTGSSSVVDWRLYTRFIGNPGDTPGAWSSAEVGTITKGDQTVSNQPLVSAFPAINTIGLPVRASTFFMFRIHRLGNSDAESNAVRLFEFDVHVQYGSAGTIIEFPQSPT